MKCNCWIPAGDNPRKRKKKIICCSRYVYSYDIKTPAPQEVDPEQAKSLLKVDDVTECGGNITAEVSAEEEPVMGGMYSKLEVNYTCDKCCGSGYLDLPQEHNISEWLTKQIEAL